MIGSPFSAGNASGRAKPTCRMLSGELPADSLIRSSELDRIWCLTWIIPHLLSEFFERHKHVLGFCMRYISCPSVSPFAFRLLSPSQRLNPSTVLPRGQ